MNRKEKEIWNLSIVVFESSLNRFRVGRNILSQGDVNTKQINNTEIRFPFLGASFAQS